MPRKRKRDKRRPESKARALTRRRSTNVKEIMRLMSEGLWFDSRSVIEWAAAQEVSVRTVEDWAAEAARLIDHLTTGVPKDRILASILRNLDAVRGIALAATRPIKMRAWDKDGKPYERIEHVLAPNTGDARAVLMDQARLHGLLVEKTEDVTPRKFEGWTVEELEHFAATGEKPKRFEK